MFTQTVIVLTRAKRLSVLRRLRVLNSHFVFFKDATTAELIAIFCRYFTCQQPNSVNSVIGHSFSI